MSLAEFRATFAPPESSPWRSPLEVDRTVNTRIRASAVRLARRLNSPSKSAHVHGVSREQIYEWYPLYG